MTDTTPGAAQAVPRYPDAARLPRYIHRLSLADLEALQARDLTRPSGWDVESAWRIARQIEAMRREPK